jgi:hypothetical protein
MARSTDADGKTMVTLCYMLVHSELSFMVSLPSYRSSDHASTTLANNSHVKPIALYFLKRVVYTRYHDGMVHVYFSLVFLVYQIIFCERLLVISDEEREYFWEPGYFNSSS